MSVLLTVLIDWRIAICPLRKFDYSQNTKYVIIGFPDER